VLNWSSVLPAQADSAAAIDVSATPRSNVRRAISPLSCRGKRGILTPGELVYPHKSRWKIEGLRAQVNEWNREFGPHRRDDAVASAD
jgi:hypothetical protein